MVTGKFKPPEPSGKTLIVANRVKPDLAARLSKYEVPCTRVEQSTWLRELMSWIVTALAFFGLRFFLIWRVFNKQGGSISIGQRQAKACVQKGICVDFSDVVGVDKAKAKLEEIVVFLKGPQSRCRLGGRLPEGVLLVRPIRYR